ncbi:FAD-dependent monooxygenase [Actinoplanes sp. NPDC026619]|uniref:FAD-dependent monooxygenase n=1 Tax=Actinoplanes sp. NPDC026619 TaxID=3155798 RepID=UPI0033C3E487
MTSTVVIAGAGPAGLLLAGELSLAGVETVVIEPRAGAGTRSSGMAIHSRTLETLNLRGLAAPIRAEMIRWPRTPFAMLWLDLDAVTESDWTYGFPQWRTETLLAEWATGQGAELRREQEVVGFTQDETGVTVDVRPATGAAYQIRAAYLVGCDGAESVVRRGAGIELAGNLPGYYGILGDVPLTDELESLFEAGPRPGGMFGALPIEEGMLRLMSIEFDREPPVDAGPPTVAELAAGVGRLNGEEPKLTDAYFLARFGGPSRVAAEYRRGRVLLAGDAAHQYFISGTQAMNTGLQDAMNLGWKLAAEIHGWAPAGLLDSYAAERQPVGRRMLLHAESVVAMLHPLDRLASLRTLFTELIEFEDVSRHLLRMTTVTRYPGGDHPLTGTAVADQPLVTASGPATIAEAMRSGHGLLLDVSGDGGPAPDVAEWSGRVETVVAAPLPGVDAEVLLIRPDGHIAYAGAKSGLRRALTAWFGGDPGSDQAPESAEIDGAWRLIVDSPMGKQDVTVRLTEAAGALTGTLTNNGNQMSTELLDGRFDGAALRWKVKLKRLPSLTFTVTIRGDDMSGTAKATMLGGFAVQGRRDR